MSIFDSAKEKLQELTESHGDQVEQYSDQAIEKAKKARAEAGIDDLRGRLADMEKAAAIIGQAMLRP